MGRTFVDVTIENSDDVKAVQASTLPKRRIRSVKVRALVDTGTSLLCLPKKFILLLGLTPSRIARARTANGVVERTIYGDARIKILSRHYWGEIMEIPDKVPVLLGCIPLENLDLAVDLKSHKVIPNPEHGGKYLIDQL